MAESDDPPACYSFDSKPVSAIVSAFAKSSQRNDGEMPSGWKPSMMCRPAAATRIVRQYIECRGESTSAPYATLTGVSCDNRGTREQIACVVQLPFLLR